MIDSVDEKEAEDLRPVYGRVSYLDMQVRFWEGS